MKTPIDLIVAKYIHQMEAQRAWNDLDAYNREIIDMARIERDDNGNIHYKDRDDLNRQEGKNIGALVGGFMGLAFGPAGLLGAAVGLGAGIAAGALTGQVVARNIDTGINDEAIRKVTQSLGNGESALLVVAPEAIGDEIVTKMGAPQAEILRYDLNIEFEEKATLSNRQKIEGDDDV
jgi:uncharacterized membrane protein